MDLGIRNHLNEVARLLPTSGISVDILEAVYPSGEFIIIQASWLADSFFPLFFPLDLSPQHARAVKLVLKTVRGFEISGESVNLVISIRSSIGIWHP